MEIEMEINKTYQEEKKFDPRPDWVIKEQERERNLLKSLPLSSNFTCIFLTKITGSDLLIRSEGVRVIFVGLSDITGTKKVIKSDKRCIVIFFNNKADKWWQRFGFCFG